MADEVTQTQDPEIKELLKLLLADKAREAKERLEKETKEQEQRLAVIKSQMEAARIQNEEAKQRRESCRHYSVHPATKQPLIAWVGQVNSDGYIVPLCNLCKTEMPKVAATEEQKKSGVRFSEYTVDQLTVPTFEKWHKNSFPNGCSKESCYVCHPVKQEEAELVAV